MIYFDHNATTRPDPEVCRILESVLAGGWGNPSSQHLPGQEARSVLTHARQQVALLLGCSGADVVFTSGGTESVCQVLLGGDALYRPGHLVTTLVEHSCVLTAAEVLEDAGWRVTRVPVDGQGRVDPEDVRKAVSPQTRLISVMTANNDTGVLQPVAAIAEIARSEAVPFHTDAVQAVGRIPFDVTRMGADFVTLSGHKFHGPKGCGAVVCGGRRRPGCLLRGGEQEWGLRAGTENVPAMAGLGVAAKLAAERLETDAAHARGLRNRLQERLCEFCPDSVVHGAGADRLPNTLSMAFPGVRGSSLAMRLDLEGVAVSTTSACSSNVHAPPHVLVAMGLSASLALSSVRFSLGRWNTVEEVDAVTDKVVRLLPELRRT